MFHAASELARKTVSMQAGGSTREIAERGSSRLGFLAVARANGQVHGRDPLLGGLSVALTLWRRLIKAHSPL